MSEYVHLIGAEEVQRAANVMSQAADDMQRAASTIDCAVDRLTRQMDDFIFRLEALHVDKPTEPAKGEKR